MRNTSHHVGPEFFSPEVVGHIESVARSMIGHSGFCEDDFKDLCQDFCLQITRAASKYDPAKGSVSTYACRVVDRHRNYIYRDRVAKHLDVPPVRIVESSDEDDADSVPCVADEGECTVDKAMLRLDVRRIVVSLPKKHRRFCEEVMDGASIREAAQAAGFSKGREVFSHVLPYLRKRFRKAEISENF